jgi:ribonuclease R
MLPEILSNNVCSLRPNEDKLTFSVIFKMNARAEVLEEWHGRTVICSDQRFAYEDAQKIIEGAEHKLEFEVREMDRLAKIIREKRMNNGALELSSTEVKFILDEKKKPIGVYTKIQKDANKLIEEFMLLANKSVARLIGGPDPKKKMLPMVYRIHDEPGDQKLSELMEFIKHMGYKLDVKNKQKLSSALNKLFASISDKREVEVIQNFSIRCMAKAIYDVNNIGHYGLAFDYYTHFTSPIRRYPDLLVHRILESFLKAKESYAKGELEKFCKHCSAQEKKAADAERMSVKYKQVEFMSDKIGKIFSGVVTGVTEWGMYVETDDQKCEGMISLRSMADDYYYYDEKSFAIIGRKTKDRYKLGTEVMIKVLKADMVLRQLDYQLVPR